MRAMILEKIGAPLQLREIPLPIPEKEQVLIKIKACAICRTDLHIFDGELTAPKLPLVLGHQIVGEVQQDGKRFKKGTRVGAAWLGKTCGTCPYCLEGNENLCDFPTFTGYTQNGGFAEFTVADEAFIFSLPDTYSDLEVAPLLCAGMIGYRSLKMAGASKKIGFYGFGAAAHILIQVAQFLGKEIYAFTREGDLQTQEIAKKMGAVWAGGSETMPPLKLDSAILFAPVGKLVPIALKALRKGGSVICAEIHMSDIPSFPYKILWEERVLRSVANLTRVDGEEFLAIVSKIPIKTTVTPYHLEDANQALCNLRTGTLSGSAVLIP